MITILVPVKDLWQAKQRLASLLTQSERRELCLVMLRDVLAALAASRLLDEVLVFSPDVEVLEIAGAHKMAVVREPEGRGQSEAVSSAIPLCRDRGSTTILTIPVDTPLLRGRDVDALIDFAAGAGLGRPSVVLVPSADGTGSNALLLTPPDALPPQFGPDSRKRHALEAQRLGVVYREFVLPRLALDIDSPGDLAAFLRAAEALPIDTTKTYPYLLNSGIASRCAALAS